MKRKNYLLLNAIPLINHLEDIYLKGTSIATEFVMGFVYINTSIKQQIIKKTTIY
ncbi:MAG: hypothetical protein U5J96_03560 [Ignavibacteriaceae bacterium]|nr:hypothetical protein [Ignavibacteriaceae bacterium]